MKNLTKLFIHTNAKSSKFTKPSKSSPKSPRSTVPPIDYRRLALKIILAGGIVEYYYMATPAFRIMEKYPRYILARPDIFCRPWESIVKPEEILTPGEEVYVVPRGTVLKLQKRMKQPSESKCRKDEGNATEKDDEYSDGLVKKGSSAAKQRRRVKKKVRFARAWEPSLVPINESSSI